MNRQPRIFDRAVRPQGGKGGEGGEVVTRGECVERGGDEEMRKA